jgi:predicted HTH transcriptional regulator
MEKKMLQSELCELLEELCSEPHEQQWLEFKMNNKDPVMIGEDISALSNGATLANKVFGYLIFGVEDDTQEIKGTTIRFDKIKKGNQNLELWLRNAVQPKINFEVFEFDYAKRHIVLLRIPRAHGQLTYFNSQAMVRVGSHTTKNISR